MRFRISSYKGNLLEIRASTHCEYWAEGPKRDAHQPSIRTNCGFSIGLLLQSIWTLPCCPKPKVGAYVLLNKRHGLRHYLFLSHVTVG